METWVVIFTHPFDHHSHVYSIFAKGFRNEGLEMDELPGCSVDDEADIVMGKLQK